LAAGTAIGSLASGAATIAKTINEKKAIDKQLKEMERHNKEIEGKGLFLKQRPCQSGKGLYLRSYKNA
ncbi:unnamed protein product, partial [Rotaria socialis]